MSRSIVGAILLGLILPLGSPAWGQIFSDTDTLSVVPTGGSPGDSIVVPIALTNTFSVGGIRLRVVYGADIFQPLSVDLASRLDGFDLYGSNWNNPGVILFFATSWHPDQNFLPPGSGPIVLISFRVAPDASPGSYYIRFENSGPDTYENSLSNVIGDSMVIPILVDGQVEISPQTGIDADRAMNPDDFVLLQNYPNPFNSRTAIAFSLPEPSAVRLEVYDLLGRMVATLFSGIAPAGKTVVIWDGKTSNGSAASSGVYYYKLEDSHAILAVKRMTLLK